MKDAVTGEKVTEKGNVKINVTYFTLLKTAGLVIHQQQSSLIILERNGREGQV